MLIIALVTLWLGGVGVGWNLGSIIAYRKGYVAGVGQEKVKSLVDVR